MSPSRAEPVVVVGAGVGGLCLAIRLASAGVPVEVFEKEPAVGGKLRRVEVGGAGVDGGPTVLTMRWAFDELFRATGAPLEAYVELAPLPVLARHYWPDGSSLDLYADREKSAAAIAAFAGAREAEGYRAFCEHARRIFEAVEGPFLRSALPGVKDLFSLRGLGTAAQALRIDATRSMWKAIGSFYRDARLRALFGRFATYVGSSPLRAPATLNVIAAVELAGVWAVRGGMYALAEALLARAGELGVRVHAGAAVDEIVLGPGGRAAGVRLAGGGVVAARAVASNGDGADLVRLVPGAPRGRLAGAAAERSLSALVLTGRARAEGAALAHHTVFFPSNYEDEFRTLFDAGRVPAEPTVYLCAQDRGPFGPGPGAGGGGGERLLVLINAPPDGDRPGAYPPEETDAWVAKILTRLRGAGLELTPTALALTTPRDFERLSPSSGGALYGPASHGMTAAFSRPASRTAVPGLYAVGGSVHPGAGVPMAALSSAICARAMADDLGLTVPSLAGATSGGTSTASATAGAMR
ncbi:MAG TPA: phytoene desaturase family protein [Polyangiaceae bacterium]|nr:phytoene desaturase family protein [Polyangiaceae bacterium]